MPVAFAVSPVSPQAVWDIRSEFQGTSDIGFLGMACEQLSELCQEMLQSSITDDERARLMPETNGFVNTVLTAYGGHHHLRIRPDDVWMAILSQLSFYVNAHAEELRQYFVAHEGKKKLVVTTVGTRYTVDFGRLALQMTRKIHENVVDRTLAEWILPAFTTTTPKDTTICAILMMSTLKHYFEYGMDITCGIPSVTLEGTKADWETILRRIDRLYELGDEPSAWANMLRPILRRFVSAFDGRPDVEFWKQVVHRRQEFCGQDDMSGWLTAFCVWSHTGAWNAGPLQPLLVFTPAPSPARALPMSRWIRLLPKRLRRLKSGQGESTRNDKASAGQADDTARASSTPALRYSRYSNEVIVDGVPYFTIAVGHIPAGYCEVDVTVNDNGQEFNCMMVAGHVASVSSASADAREGVFDTILPSPQWFMFEKVSDS